MKPDPIITMLIKRLLALSLTVQVVLTCRPGDLTISNNTNSSDAKVLYLTARHYAKGEGVPKDFTKAAEFMRQAAVNGNAFAQNDLGTYYAKGLGVKQSFQTAAQWYQMAADQGDALAQYSLGLAYSLGRGVTNDPSKAIFWLKRSADQDLPEAMLALGDIYLTGRSGITNKLGIRIDLNESLKWFKMALKHGRVESLNSIGYIYEHGAADFPSDLNQSLQCYREAAEKNDGLGQLNLGRMYQQGFGVKKNPVEAYKWFYLAKQNGQLNGDHYIMELEGRLRPNCLSGITPDQITEAIRQADEFKESLTTKK